MDIWKIRRRIGENVQKLEPLFSADGNENMVQLLWKIKQEFLWKLNKNYHMILQFHFRELKADMCTPRFIATLFIIAKRWKQPKCSWTDECMNKIYYICIVEYYSSLKRNEILIWATTWMNYEDISLSGIKQSQKDRCCTLYEMSTAVKFRNRK